MPTATYIDDKDQCYVVEIENGTTLMQAAVDNLVPEILGDCGGVAACATCHIRVAPEWAERAGAASELELDLLDGLLDTGPTSRLACQMTMNENLDGIVLHVPDQQL